MELIQSMKGSWRKKALSSSILFAFAAQTQGLEYYNDGFELQIDSSLSIGASWRDENPSEKLLDLTNNNDGNKNYDKGDVFSKVFKGSHDLQMSYENFGAFARVKYWYDAELENNDKLDDSDYHDLAKFSGIELLDAFVYGEFDIMNMPLDLRLGKQVLNWGESTYIQGGLNVSNPYDVSAFRRPGATLKEGLIPVNMVSASLGLSDSISLETFYMLEFRETVLEGCGTYFSTNDYAGPGCDNVIVSTGADGIEGTDDDITIDRHNRDIRSADADGQYGIAMRVMSESLDTDFGFYFTNLHSNIPVVSGEKAIVDEVFFYNALYPNGFTSAQDAIDLGNTIVGITTGAAPVPGTTPNNFYMEYPENIKTAGISFATNIATVAVSGEITHKSDVPVQINDEQLILATISADYQVKVLGLTNDVATVEYAAEVDGDEVIGNRFFDISQAQVSFIKTIDQVLGASRYAVVTEFGYTYIHDFDDSDSADYKFSGVRKLDGSYIGTTTQESWGYRMSVSGDYSDVFAGIAISPTVYWAQDVSGYSPNPGGNFKEGTERLGLSLRADYMNSYNAEISYTTISGGETQFDTDRDFASITLGMQF